MIRLRNTFKSSLLLFEIHVLCMNLYYMFLVFVFEYPIKKKKKEEKKGQARLTVYLWMSCTRLKQHYIVQYNSFTISSMSLDFE